MGLGAAQLVGAEGPARCVVEFRLDGQRFGVDLFAVERVLPMVAVSPLPGAPAIALGVVNVHGTPVPVLDIGRRLGLPGRDYGPAAQLLLTRTMRRTIALPVDEVVGPAELTEGMLTPTDAIFDGVHHVSGIVALEHGLLFIYDLEGFLSVEEEAHLNQAIADAAGG